MSITNMPDRGIVMSSHDGVAKVGLPCEDGRLRIEYLRHEAGHLKKEVIWLDSLDASQIAKFFAGAL